MEEIIKAIKDLEVPKEHRDEFEEFKKEILKDAKYLNKDLIRELKKLKHHHLPTIKHSIRVAFDVKYIAEQLNKRGIKRYSKEDIRDITTAALVHDIGKLKILDLILNLGDIDERKAVFKRANPGKEIPNTNLLQEISILDIINYKADFAANPKEYKNEIIKWLKQVGSRKYIHRSLLCYLKSHQEHSEKILEALHISKKVVDIATGHHPEYFDNEEKRKIPDECKIILIADKFNAMIQSEGLRTYIKRLSPIESFDIIVNNLIRELSNIKNIDKAVIGILLERYIPAEIERIKEEFIELSRGRSINFKKGMKLKEEIDVLINLLDKINLNKNLSYIKKIEAFISQEYFGKKVHNY
jgi:hypothetical protein